MKFEKPKLIRLKKANEARLYGQEDCSTNIIKCCYGHK